MHIIQTIDSQRFSLDGILYFKNFLSFVTPNEKICVYNAYDRRDERIPLIPFTEIELDGVVYGSAAALQTALLPVIYTRDTLGDLIISSPFYNKFIIVNGYSLADQELTILANWQWMLNGVIYTNPGSVIINIPYSAAGKKRIDIIVANSNNTFIRLSGDEVPTAATAVAPDVPANVLTATFLTVTEDSISEPNDPYTGNYLGQYRSREVFEDATGTFALNGDFGFVRSNYSLELVLYFGNSYNYYDLLIKPLEPLEVRVFKKAVGNNGGFTKEPGDWVSGEPEAGVYWVWAIVGADPQDYTTYEVKSSL